MADRRRRARPPSIRLYPARHPPPASTYFESPIPLEANDILDGPCSSIDGEVYDIVIIERLLGGRVPLSSFKTVPWLPSWPPWTITEFRCDSRICRRRPSRIYSGERGAIPMSIPLCSDEVNFPSHVYQLPPARPTTGRVPSLASSSIHLLESSADTIRTGTESDPRRPDRSGAAAGTGTKAR